MAAGGSVISFQRKVSFLKYRFKRTPKWVFFVAAGAFCVWILVGSQRGHGKTRKDVHITAARQDIIKNYCNFPMRAYGDEGSIPQTSSRVSRLQLEMAQVLIRHGDRTPAMQLPNVNQLAYDYGCSVNSADLNSTTHNEFKKYNEAVQYFKQRKLSPQAKIHLLSPSGGTCEYAQLTRRGFLQHFQLGRHFSNVYKKLLYGLDFLDGQLYARSTNRERTVQSAAALLYGLMPEEIIKKGGMAINIATDIWFRENDDGKLQVCPALHKVQTSQKKSPEYRRVSSQMEPVMFRIARLLRVPRTALPSIVYVTDAVATHTCHGHPLPCGPGGCITDEMAAVLLQFSEQAFVNNYSRIAAIVSHPLLTQIAQRMIDKSERKTSLRFSLYSGHDTSILPVLLALGLHDGKWSPYATRLVFELWKEPSTKTAGFMLKNYYFRVVLNGEVVTKKLRFCQNGFHRHGNLCAVSDLLRWLSGDHGIHGMKQRYLSLCEAKPGQFESNLHQESVEDRV